MARLGLQWGTVVWFGLAASCVLGPVGCTEEDEPDDTTPDASADVQRDTRSDTSVTPDVRSDVNTADQREGGTPDVSADTTADARVDVAPEGGNCVGGGDAARDGALGMLVVQQLACARCHQDEPVDAGLILSGKLVSIVNDAGVFPKNLTPDPATGLGCWTDEQIINAFMNGVDESGQNLCTRMPRYGTRIDGGAAQLVVDYLRTIPAVNKAIPETTVCPPMPPQGDGGTDAGDGGTPIDGGPDATPDAGPDVAPDGGPDATPDGTSTDGGTDSAAPDAGADGATDTGTDAGSDADATGADAADDATGDAAAADNG